MFEKEIDNKTIQGVVRRDKVVSLYDKIRGFAEDELISELVNISDERLKELRYILLLRNPVSGVEPTAAEIRSFLSDLPAFILAVHASYSKVRFYREDLDEKLDKAELILYGKCEDLVRTERLNEKDSGDRQAIGQITKDQIRTKMVLHPDYTDIENKRNHIRETRYVEGILEKTVMVLENRRWELSSILKVELSAHNIENMR